METLKEDLKEYYPELENREYRSLSKMLQDTGETFLFILDEWDSVFYEKFMSDRDKSSFLKFLKGLPFVFRWVFGGTQP